MDAGMEDLVVCSNDNGSALSRSGRANMLSTVTYMLFEGGVLETS